MRNVFLFDRLESLCKGWFVVSQTFLVPGFSFKERVPEIDFFEQQRLQTPTERTAFQTEVNGRTCRVTPLYD